MIEKLASNLEKNDEQPNIELVEKLCKNENPEEIKEIVEGLKSKEKEVENDCIKVLYEVGRRKPYLIAEYVETFLELLQSQNNRLSWGAMIALATIADLEPTIIFRHLDMVKMAYEKGSIITVDNSISVFAKLCKADKKYKKVIFPLLMEHLKSCRAKEIPQHAERMLECITIENREIFLKILGKRQKELTVTQNVRVNKIIKRCKIT